MVDDRLTTTWSPSDCIGAVGSDGQMFVSPHGRRHDLKSEEVTGSAAQFLPAPAHDNRRNRTHGALPRSLVRSGTTELRFLPVPFSER